MADTLYNQLDTIISTITQINDLINDKKYKNNEKARDVRKQELQKQVDEQKAALSELLKNQKDRDDLIAQLITELQNSSANSDTRHALKRIRAFQELRPLAITNEQMNIITQKTQESQNESIQKLGNILAETAQKMRGQAGNMMAGVEEYNKKIERINALMALGALNPQQMDELSALGDSLTGSKNEALKESITKHLETLANPSAGTTLADEENNGAGVHADTTLETGGAVAGDTGGDTGGTGDTGDTEGGTGGTDGAEGEGSGTGGTEGTEEEAKKDPILDEIRASYASDDEYLNDIDSNSLISDEAIEAAMALEECDFELGMKLTAIENTAVALMDPDHMLQAWYYYEENRGKLPEDELNKKKEKLKSVIHANLQDIYRSVGSVTPDGAYAWLSLADKLKDDPLYKDDYKDHLLAIRQDIKSFDTGNFNGLSNEDIEMNYLKAVAALSDINGVTKDKDGKDVSPFEGYTFTDNKGKPYEGGMFGLKKDPSKDIKDHILQMAREKVALDLAKGGDLSPENLNKLVAEAVGDILTKNAPLPQEYNDKEVQVLFAEMGNVQDEANVKLTEKKDKLATPEEKAKLDEQLKKYEEEFKDAKPKNAEGKDFLDGFKLGAKTSENREDLEAQIRKAAVIELILRDDVPQGDTPEEKKTRQEMFEKLLAEKTAAAFKPFQDKANNTFNRDEVASYLGVQMAHAESFKARLKQRAKDTKLYQTVSARLSVLDTKLTKTFGQPYIVTKKISKKLAKIGINAFTKKENLLNAAKSAAILGSIALVGTFGGVATTVSSVAMLSYIGYQGIKAQIGIWKGTKLKDNNNKLNIQDITIKGIQSVIGAGLSAVSIIGLGSTPPGAQEAANNFVQDIVTAVSNKLARVGLSTASATLPEAVDIIKVAGEKRKISKELANTTDGFKTQELIKKQNELNLRLNDNIEKATSKAVGVFAGMLMYSAVSNAEQGVFDAIGDRLHGFGGHDAATAEAPVETAEQADSGHKVFTDDNGKLHMTDSKGAEVDSIKVVKDTLNYEQVGTDNDGNPIFKDAEGNYHNAEETFAEVEAKETAAAEAEAEPEKTNAELNKEKGTGYKGQSAEESIDQRLAANRHLMRLNDDQIAHIKASMMENYGPEMSNEAVTIALAAPTPVMEALGITVNDLPNHHFSSGNLLLYLADHPECANNEAFQNLVGAHFGPQDEFRWGNIQHNTPVQGNGGGGNGQVTQPQTVVIEEQGQGQGQEQPIQQQIVEPVIEYNPYPEWNGRGPVPPQFTYHGKQYEFDPCYSAGAIGFHVFKDVTFQVATGGQEPPTEPKYLEVGYQRGDGGHDIGLNAGQNIRSNMREDYNTNYIHDLARAALDGNNRNVMATTTSNFLQHHAAAMPGQANVGNPGGQTTTVYVASTAAPQQSQATPTTNSYYGTGQIGYNEAANEPINQAKMNEYIENYTHAKLTEAQFTAAINNVDDAANLIAQGFSEKEVAKLMAMDHDTRLKAVQGQYQAANYDIKSDVEHAKGNLYGEKARTESAKENIAYHQAGKWRWNSETVNNITRTVENAGDFIDASKGFLNKLGIHIR